MMLLRLAVKNILGAGIRSWLNALVISIALVAVVWNQSILSGFDDQATQAMTEVEYGGGQYRQKDYDPLDPLSIDRAHAVVPPALSDLIASGRATDILVIQGSIYPSGRIRSILIKGIDPRQKVLSIPSSVLDAPGEELPAFIGTRMAKSTGLGEGDVITVRWREAGGSFNAVDARIIRVMSTTVPTVDAGQIWVPLDRLRAMALLEGQSTLVVLGRGEAQVGMVPGWEFKSLDDLLADIRDLLKVKSIGRTILFVILLFLGMLAVFDTQVLSIFRRRKEMGMLMALGFTRGRVIRLFTLEGALHGVLAVLLAAVYGIPLFYLQAVKGFAVPANTEDFGFSIGEKIFPAYSAILILGTTAVVLLVTTLVSFLPTRKIARLKPTDALRGRTS